jgi:hypothetical protein
VGVRSTAQAVDTLVSQGVTKPRVPVFAVKAKKVRYLSFHQVSCGLYEFLTL